MSAIAAGPLLKCLAATRRGSNSSPNGWTVFSPANSPDRGIEYSLQRAVLPWGEARGRESIQGDTRPTEQRSHRAKRPLPEGLRRFWLVASLLVGSQSPTAMLPSSRLATSQNRQQQTVFYPAVW